MKTFIQQNQVPQFAGFASLNVIWSFITLNTVAAVTEKMTQKVSLQIKRVRRIPSTQFLMKVHNFQV